MSYIRSLKDGSPAAGFNFGPDASGGEGLLSMIVLELQKQTRLLEELLLLETSKEEAKER